MANEVRITVGADTKSAEQNMKSFRSRVDSIGAGATRAGLALTAMGAAGTMAIKGFIGAALEQEKAEAAVEVAVRNSGESYAALRDVIAETTSGLQKKSKFGDEVQLQALSQLIPMMGSTEAAMAALSAVNEVAAVTQTDLLSAVRSVGPALAGQTDRIRGTAVEFDKAMGPIERVDETMRLLGGTAQSQVDPFTQMNMAMGDLKEVIGSELIPLLAPFVQKLTSIFERLQTMNPAVKEIGAAFLLAATALGAIGGPLLLFIGLLFKLIPAILGVNLAAGPMILVIIGVTAAITAAILVWRNWDKVVLFVKERINNFIEVLNNKVIPILNNLIKAFNFVTRSSVDTIEPLKKLDTTVKKVAETTQDAAEKTTTFKTSMKDLSDFAHITNDELGEMIESTDKAPNGLTYGEIVEKMSITSPEEYMTILRDYGKVEGVNTNESQRLDMTEPMTFEIDAPVGSRSAVLNITFIDTDGTVAYPTIADGYFDVETIDNSDQTTTITLDFSDDQYLIEAGSVVRSDMQFGDTRLVVAGDLLTEESTGISQINITPVPAEGATVTPVEYLITLSYI